MRTEQQKRDDRFFDKVEKNGPFPEARPELGRCWVWVGALYSNGYSHFYYGAEMQGVNKGSAHRFSYMRFKGPIKEDQDIDHLCRNRSCVNPDHLEAVDRRTNLLRGLTAPARNLAKTHCPRGHAYEGENLILRKDKSRACRECVREAQKRKYEKYLKNETPEQLETRRRKQREAQARFRNRGDNRALDRTKSLKYRHAHLEEVREKQRIAAREKRARKTGRSPATCAEPLPQQSDD